MTSYRIDDEPLPGPLSRWSTSPYFCLLAVMLGGVWLSWPWFVFNGKAMGSPTFKREALWTVAGLVGTVCIVVVILFLAGRGVLPKPYVKYAAIAIPTWKLLVSYVLYDLQSRTFHLYEYYGGTVRNGMPVVLFGMFFGRTLLALLPSEVWRVILG